MKKLLILVMITTTLGFAQSFPQGRQRGNMRPDGPPPPPPEALLMSADTNYDHVISVDEWTAYIERLPYTDDGQLDIAELHARAAYHRANRPGQSQAEPRNHPVDQNNDGFLAEEDLQAIFARLDQDGDGQLSESEIPKPPRRGHRKRATRHHNYGKGHR